MRMIGETYHLQDILGRLDKTIESKAAVVHRQRERSELILACGNANRQAGPDLEAKRIVKQTAFFRRLCASRIASIPGTSRLESAISEERDRCLRILHRSSGWSNSSDRTRLVWGHSRGG